MFNTPIFEVAIGLIFVFSLMAILVTQINSIITTLLNMRAKELKSGIQELVTDKNVQARILGHPLIQMVKHPVPSHAHLSAQAAETVVNSTVNRVNNIAPTTFVDALVGILLSEAHGGLGQLQKAINAMPSSIEKSQLRELIGNLQDNFSEANLRTMYEIIVQIADEETRNTLFQGFQTIEDILQKLDVNSNQLVPLLNGVSKIDDPKLKLALSTILSTTKNLQEAELKLEQWFNDSMDRVSDAFKRKLQFFSLLAAFTLAVIFNVDTLYLGRTLWEDPALRTSIIAAATEFDQSDVRTSGGDKASAKDIKRQTEEAQQTVQELLELQLPIGWQLTTVTDEMIQTSLSLGLPDPALNARNVWNLLPGNNDQWWSLLIQKLIGLLATTIAAAQGAPFWFDLLNNLTNRRNDNNNNR